MIKLYRSAMHPKQWIAYVEGSGWVMFPARENGWESRQAARGLDPVYLRQVPAHLAESAGLPEPEFCGAA
ncbi:MAG: hypothetical protein ABSF62_16830 [Bryobacteraceae bacterium]|jgi:hypothetical protein